MSTGVTVDADFARDVLADLYTYPRKRAGVAWALWLTLGIVGGHRFYLGRYGTALLMLFTGGGGLLWWIIDAFLLPGMVRSHNDEQERRRDAGEPPLELSFMPALSDEVLRSPPAWTMQWQARSRARRIARFAGDVLVIIIAGVALGAVATIGGAEEAIFAVFAMLAVTAAGDATAGLEHVPVARSLVRWSHRLRLFYYYNEPRSPIGLLLRPIVGFLLAPFKPRVRAEVRLYLQLGFVFTLFFLLLDIVPHLVRSNLFRGAVEALFGVWFLEASVTFLVTYAFAAPIGAVLTLYMLTRPTHRVPRLFSTLAFAAILTGFLLRR